MFTQLPYIEKEVEPYNRLFRTVLDYALHDITSLKEEDRIDATQWLNLQNPDFIETCFFAGLNPTRVYNMFLFFLRSFFPKQLQQLYCYQDENSVIVEFSSKLTSLTEDELNKFKINQ